VNVQNLINDCEFEYAITVNCDMPELPDSIAIDTTVILGQEHTICLTSDQLMGEITSIRNVCMSTGKVDFTLDIQNNCVTYTGVELGQDMLCMEICDVTGTCEIVTIAIEVILLASLDTVDMEIVLGTTEQVCLEPEILPGTLTSVTNICSEASGMSVEVIMQDGQACFDLTGLALGQDEACIVLCDDTGVCDTTVFNITVRLPENDTVRLNILLGQDTSYCMDLTELSGNIERFENFCGVPTNVNVNLNQITACINIETLSLG